MSKKPAPKPAGRKSQKQKQAEALRLRFDGRFLRFAATAFAIYQEFQAITEPISTVEGIKARAACAIKFLQAFAAVTDSPNDDQLATSLQALLENESLMQLLATLLGAFGGQEPQKLVESIEQDERGQQLIEELNLKGIDWNQLIQLILKLLEIFGSKPPVTPPTTTPGEPPFGFPAP